MPDENAPATNDEAKVVDNNQPTIVQEQSENGHIDISELSSETVASQPQIVKPEPVLATENSPQNSPTPQQLHSSKVSDSPRVSLFILVSLLLAGATGAGAYYWRDATANDQKIEMNVQIASLKSQLESQDGTVKTQAQPKTNEEMKNIIKDAITNQDTAILESHFATSYVGLVRAYWDTEYSHWTNVTVSTFAKMTAYMYAAKTPWNFDLSDSVRRTYSIGNFDTYIPTTAIVGKSADNQVIAITLDSNMNIKQIFFAEKESSLIDESLSN